MQHIRNSIIPMFEGFCRKNEIDGKDIVATISGIKVTLNVAANIDTQAKGLMGSDEPENNNGMIFVYDSDDTLEFWMKNVEYPLDILFFNSKLELEDNLTMSPYSGEADEDLKIYKSKSPARYAVELRSGWAESNLKGDTDVTLKF